LLSHLEQLVFKPPPLNLKEMKLNIQKQMPFSLVMPALLSMAMLACKHDKGPDLNSPAHRIAMKEAKAPVIQPTNAVDLIDVKYAAIYRFTKINP
jgi:hypothetical protein